MEETGNDNLVAVADDHLRVAPLARCSNARTAAVLLPSRTPAAFGFGAFLGALAALLAPGAVLR